MKAKHVIRKERPQDAAVMLVRDAIEAPKPHLPTITRIAQDVGCNRVTLWRDSRFRTEYSRAREILESKSSRDGRSKAMIDDLRRENERLLKAFVVIASRIQARGIDPSEIMGDLAVAEMD